MTDWIKFLEGPQLPKTRTWTVVTLDEREVLGQIRWFGRWRKYAFFPERETVFEQDCLRRIASFCEEQTAAQRAARSAT